MTVVEEWVQDRAPSRVSAAGMLARLNAPDHRAEAGGIGMATGFTPLDDVLDGGLSIGDLCVLGGAPGVGKTIAALQMARNMAAAGHRVMYCCYEHDVPTLLGRLVALEIGDLGACSRLRDDAVIRSSVQAIMAGRWSPAHAGYDNEVVRAAMARVEEYGERLVLTQLSTAEPGLDVIRAHVRRADKPFQAMFVDYLQKIGVDGAAPGLERWTVAVEELKELALAQRCLVVAISAVDRDALARRRVTVEGFRGAEAIAHEADVAIVVNEKIKLVSRAHLAYDPTLYAGFSRKQVFTVEKNRRGPAAVDIEFDKDFSRFRFDTRGDFVAERLIDYLMVME